MARATESLDKDEAYEPAAVEPLVPTAISRIDLERAIAQLPAGYRAAFVLHDVEGLDHREVAETLGISEGTSKSQVHKARHRLRRLLSAPHPQAPYRPRATGQSCMTCDESALLIDDYVDGACDPVTSASVRHHLQGCAACRALAEDLSRIREASSTLGPLPPPAQVWTGIQARLQADAGGPPHRGWRHLLAAAAGFALLASGLSWLGAHLPPAVPGLQVANVEPGRTVSAGRGRVSDGDRRPGVHHGRGRSAVTAEPAFVALQASLYSWTKQLARREAGCRRSPTTSSRRRAS